FHVTGVQTCALPIYRTVHGERVPGADGDGRIRGRGVAQPAQGHIAADGAEERRVRIAFGVADDLAGKPGTGVVLVAVVGLVEGDDVPADHLGVVGTLDGGSAAEQAIQ